MKSLRQFQNIQVIIFIQYILSEENQHVSINKYSKIGVDYFHFRAIYLYLRDQDYVLYHFNLGIRNICLYFRITYLYFELFMLVRLFQSYIFEFQTYFSRENFTQRVKKKAYLDGAAVPLVEFVLRSHLYINHGHYQ